MAHGDQERGRPFLLDIPSYLPGSTAQKSQWKRTGQSWWATWKTGAVSSVGTSQASLTRASRSPFEGTLKDVNFVFEYRVDLRPWIAEDHRLIAKYDGKVSVKKETVKVEMIKEGSGWVLQLDSELEPMELGSKWWLRNNYSFSQLLPSVASVCL